VGVTVGIDIGTTSVKAVAAGDDGAVLARARVPHPIVTPFAGAFEHDVDVAWRANVVEALRLVATELRDDIAAVNVAAMVPSLGPVGADGRAVGPGLLYGDARGRGGDRNTQPGDSGELLGFLGWLAANCPDAAGFWPAQGVANHALSGRGAIDSTTAVTAHPLFDFVGWDAELAAGAGTTPDALPEVVGGTAPVGSVSAGLPGEGALLGGGTIDALGEQLVAGADEPGDVLVICGTTLITWGVLPADAWADVPGLWTIPHTAPGTCLVGGPSNAGGLFLDRARRWLADVDPDELIALDPSDLPVWLPYVRGERTPLHDTSITAAVHGLTLAHSPAHVLQAAYEAAGFVVRHHLDLAAAGAGLAPRRLVATGGGSQVGPWVQALADCTGLPVDVVAVPEGAALGSAFIARCTAGLESNMTDARRWARTGRTVDPRPEWADAAAARYETFRALTAQASSRE
jgi:xylulokinase